jgi:hypothetical protein
MAASTLGLFTEARFLTGLSYGVAGMVAAAAVRLAWPKNRDKPLPIAGLLVTVAALASLSATRSVPASVWIGASLGSLAGLAASTTGPVLGIPAAIPGAWLLAFHGDPSGEAWIRWFILGAIVLAAPLVADFDGRHGAKGFGPPLFTLAVLGVFFAVPDTEEATVLLGVTLPFAILGWPRSVASLGGAGAGAAVCVLVWVIAQGGHARPGTIVAATACLGILVAEPLGVFIAGRRNSILGRLPPGAETGIVVGSAQLLVVFLASRVAGGQSEVWKASLIAGLLIAITAWLAGSGPLLANADSSRGQEADHSS